MSSSSEALQATARRATGGLPPLLAQAERLAATVVLGDHGRRRAGMGEEFWQYRQAIAGDAASTIDWRRSARSDAAFVRQTEWSAAQTVTLSVDPALSMDYPQQGETKRARAAVLGCALSLLLVRGGERVALAHPALPAGGGRMQVDRIAEMLSISQGRDEYSVPVMPNDHSGLLVVLSDFLAPDEVLVPALDRLATQGQRVVMLQVMDQSEEAFPFDGRTEFRSMSGAISFEAQRARSLRDGYQARLAARRDMLRTRARLSGWSFNVHRVQDPAGTALLWLHRVIEGERR
ncbi:Protein of unknown function DUF58 [Monaibacterium marinum]|uniref:DUF58 domain-containing protein n=1 Tax=Pontivivens marinum TaxID=1690039 RepID=A0A2C9CVH0_9RHOB|nr:DUF58 domain-containing protein [Monaibacterium marinum]SOH95200.1 Protein of unknown function DUF58 [Monaibacterium marinum]